MTRKAKPPVPLYSALADATRCRIIEILVGGPIPVHRLADAFAISRPAISRHLRVLKTAGLVAEVKKGRENLYALRPQKLERAVAWIEGLAIQPSPDVEVPQVAVEPSASASALPPELDLEITDAVEKKQRPPRPKGEPLINQMGFDF